MSKIRMGSYSRTKGDNYGTNSLWLRHNDLTVWFSYETIVAFQHETDDRKATDEKFGPTTAKHINWINPDVRLPKEEFRQALYEALEMEGLELVSKV